MIICKPGIYDRRIFQSILWAIEVFIRDNEYGRIISKRDELWETAEQLIKQHKIDSSEGCSEMVSYQKQAVECWQTAAEQGDARAQHQLGYYYYNYRKNSNKNKKAFEWYSKAAEQGYAPAQYELGFLYSYGLGIPMNYKMSRYWYEKAAEGGMASAP